MPTAGNPLGGEIVRRSYGRPAGPLAGSWLDQPRRKHLASHPRHSSPLRRLLHDRPPDRWHHLFDFAGHPHWLASGGDLVCVCAQPVQDGSEDREGVERAPDPLRGNSWARLIARALLPTSRLSYDNATSRAGLQAVDFLSCARHDCSNAIPGLGLVVRHAELSQAMRRLDKDHAHRLERALRRLN